MQKNGRLIVIDGVDGSGKSTQLGLLAGRLKKEGRAVKIVDFPEYSDNFFGQFIGHCLTEQYFNWLKVHPKIASVIYAADRFESKEKIENWLAKGYVVLANRYVSANQIHQGGKIASLKKREAFIKWLDEMEYQVFKIPRPDVILYLSLPVPIILNLIKERDYQAKRQYLKRGADLHENNLDFLNNSRKSALWLVKKIPNFIKIDCAMGNKILSREAIHEKIYGIVKRIIK
jgi:dTMP kinase